MIEPKRTSRIRRQTAVLLSAIAMTVKSQEDAMINIPFETLSTDPKWIKHRSDLEYNKTLLLTTTDHYGTAKIKTKAQGTRLIRAGCASCGYTIRLSQLWIITGLPNCPNPHCTGFGKPFEVDETPSNKEFLPYIPDTIQLEQDQAIDKAFDAMVKESQGNWLTEVEPQHKPKGKRK